MTAGAQCSDGRRDDASHSCILRAVLASSLPSVDIAVDPLDGTTACATGKPGAVAVIALAERGALFDPGPAFYMNKLAVGPDAAEVIDIRFGAPRGAAHRRQRLTAPWPQDAGGVEPGPHLRGTAKAD